MLPNALYRIVDTETRIGLCAALGGQKVGEALQRGMRGTCMIEQGRPPTSSARQVLAGRADQVNYGARQTMRCQE